MIFTTHDKKYNLDKWINSSAGKLLITGLVGSGKSTLAKEMGEKYNVKVIELDTYICIDKDKVKFLKDENKIEKLLKYYQLQIDNTIDTLFKSEEKLIIEGIQIFLYSNKQKYRQHSVVIKGTSILTSFIRAYNRNKNSRFAREWGKTEVMLDIYYNLFIKKVYKFKQLIDKWNKR
jgi:cytidylate kinase